MADAWSTVVTREPEWDEYGRAQIVALMAFESRQCPACGNYGTLVDLPDDRTFVTWDEHDGRKITVRQYRCLACGAKELIQRGWNAEHDKDEPTEGRSSLPRDGRIFVARPFAEEDRDA